ncbi:SusC/RagA family TonB-linked outer membrane protein [Robertkochia solimangrovi]|uniref:SusC/RagA family TonB-linked outer membrane protein n=1 Tax=Robertkochia solimangrovi TaxID=2213046 RepID=UPI00118152BB|nr:SusC/RagA family TonB-linked outer membrane protein [Robertkochia solimangrovi]TRZ45738.1 hypothetical protein DMZ48_00200 [Robertkochia solimangrovi]
MRFRPEHILVILCLLFISEMNAQKKRITLDLVDVPLIKVLEDIERQSRYEFAYLVQTIDPDRRVTIKVNEAKINRTLELLFKDTTITYKIIDDQIILSKEENALEKDNLPLTTVVQNSRTYFGIISDENGIPIPGVTISTSDYRFLGFSDAQGRFAITVSTTANQLYFSYVGFETKNIDLSNLVKTSGLSVIMTEEVNFLDEIVLTGYQDIPSERMAGSYDKADEEVLANRIYTNPLERVLGRLSGLNFNPYSQNLEVRGQSSLLRSSTQPLIVLDGFPMTDQSNLAAINAEDIASVTLLKDAAAASVWGARASNGVLVIETKKGERNTPLQLELSTFIEIEKKVNTKDFSWLTTTQELEFDQEYYDKGYSNLPNYLSLGRSLNNFHLAKVYLNGLSPNGDIWSQHTYENYIAALRQYDIGKDWERYLIRNQIRQIYNLSFRGGSSQHSYYGSVSYNQHLGQLMGNSDDRLTANFKNDLNFSKYIRLKLGVNGVLKNEKLNGLTFTDLRNAQPYDRLIDDHGFRTAINTSWNPWISHEREELTGLSYAYNSLAEQENRDNTSHGYDIRADISLEIDLLKNLQFATSFRFEEGEVVNNDFKNMDLPSYRFTIADFYVDSAFRIPLGSDYTKNTNSYMGWTFRNTLSYDLELEKHSLSLFAGAEYQRRFLKTILSRKLGYDKSDGTYVPLSAIGLESVSITDWYGNRYPYSYRSFENENIDDNRFVNFFANMGYSFHEEFLLNANIRIDQANIYGNDPSFRYKPLWSVGAGWIPTKSLIPDSDVLNYLKIRISAGTGGNTIFNLSPYPTAIHWSNSNGYFYPYSYYYEPGNPNLKWEETKIYDIGVDFTLFDNQLYGSLDIYFKKSDDLIGLKSLDPTNGFLDGFVNYAAMKNRGYEIKLGGEILRSSSFEWKADINFNYNKNKIINYENLNSTPDEITAGIRYFEEYPANGLFAYNYAGLNEHGDIMLYDTDGRKKLWSEAIGNDELVYEGPRTPPYYGGFSTSLRYGSFDLSVNTAYQFGHVFRYSIGYGIEGYGAGNNISEFSSFNLRMNEAWAHRWQNPGDELTTQIPRIPYNGYNPEKGVYENYYTAYTSHRIWSQSSYQTYEADNFRIQDIIFGYTLRGFALKSSSIKSLRFTLQWTNPYVWLKNERKIDPQNPKENAYANLPRLIFGLRAKL